MALCLPLPFAFAPLFTTAQLWPLLIAVASRSAPAGSKPRLTSDRSTGAFTLSPRRSSVLHTSASLALNESWDPDVRDDMEMMLNKIVPEGLEYRHSCEGPDDMPAHVKACFLGSSLSIPITDGKLALGTWQGIWLGEHRDHAGSRKLVVTLTGVLRDSARSPLSPVSPIASTSS